MEEILDKLKKEGVEKIVIFGVIDKGDSLRVLHDTNISEEESDMMKAVADTWKEYLERVNFIPNIEQLVDALNWLTHACCGVSKSGGKVSQSEYEEAIDNAKQVLTERRPEEG